MNIRQMEKAHEETVYFLILAVVGGFFWLFFASAFPNLVLLVIGVILSLVVLGGLVDAYTRFTSATISEVARLEERVRALSGRQS